MFKYPSAHTCICRVMKDEYAEGEKMRGKIRYMLAGLIALLAMGGGQSARAEAPAPPAPSLSSSPCEDSLTYLETQYRNDERTRIAFDLVYQGLVDPPAGYAYLPTKNPWRAAGNGAGLKDKMVSMFREWCTALPEIHGTSDNALDGIQYFAWLYYHNEAGVNFVQGRYPADATQPLETGAEFLYQFTQQLRGFMDSPASAKLVPEWVSDPRIEIGDYVTDRFDSWNAFFARRLKQNPDGGYPSRPVTMPDKDYVIVAPTDCIMNPLVQVLSDNKAYRRQLLENPLRLDTVLDVKNIPVSVRDLLAGTPEEVRNSFVGGSGLSCILMPNTYHNFHAPVDGTIVHKEVVASRTKFAVGTFGYSDWPNWVPLTGNVGGPGTDFSQFERFQRGVIVVKVEYANLPGEKPEKLTGYVAVIPVGLDTVGSVVLDDAVTVGATVKKGVTRFGNFYFGGSLNILLFSKGMVTPAVQVRMGNQIGVINVGKAPRTPWSPVE